MTIPNMSSSSIPNELIPNFEAIAEGYKASITQSLQTGTTLQDKAKDPEGKRLISSYPDIIGESGAIIRRMKEYDQMNGGKKRVSTALEIYCMGRSSRVFGNSSWLGLKEVRMITYLFHL